MLQQRVITAVILVAALLVIFSFFSQQWIEVFFALVILLAGQEWAKLSAVKSKNLQWLFGFFVALSGWLAWQLFDEKVFLAFLQLVSLFWLFAVFYLLFAVKEINPQQTLSLSKLLLGFLILVAAFLAVCLLLARFDQQRVLLLLLVAVVWITDSGAYFVGKAIGKNKFSPVISPGKTWQGVFGGLFIAALYGFFVTPEFVSEDYRMAFFILIILSAWVSIFGDLLESLIKRQAGIKDSGHILPGHGGILDRIDSLLAFLPVMATGLSYVA